MVKKQDHSGTGDNVQGNKYQQNIGTDKYDLSSKIQLKISCVDNKQEYNLKDNKILIALKEVIVELIEEEQNKPHQLVPIGKIRKKFKNLFDDKTFEIIIQHLIKDNSIEIENAQICFVNKQINYKINL